jgi:hypothetical protein
MYAIVPIVVPGLVKSSAAVAVGISDTPALVPAGTSFTDYALGVRCPERICNLNR